MDSRPSSSRRPSAPCIHVTQDISIQPPLSRRGHGPGLVLVVSAGLDLVRHDRTLDPPPRQKWAEEGYAVVQILVGPGPAGLAERLSVAVAELGKRPECTGESFGLVAMLGEDASGNALVLDAIKAQPRIVGSVVYGSYPKGEPSVPTIAHVPGDHSAPRDGQQTGRTLTVHGYPGAAPFFAIPAHQDYRAGAAAVAHTRSLSFLKPLMGGPYFDLGAIWDEHTRYEFADRSVEETMATMVDEPYVNHVPTLTGGIGRASLTAFYRDNFIFRNPDDTVLELVSRTVGIDRVVDEFVVNLTHDKVVDWLLPGIPPTFKKISFPCASVVNIRGDRLYHEHISWDQGTVLRQLGLLPDYLPFPYALPGGKEPAPGNRFEYRVPVAGMETAQKLADENARPSNEMITRSGSFREVPAKDLD